MPRGPDRNQVFNPIPADDDPDAAGNIPVPDPVAVDEAAPDPAPDPDAPEGGDADPVAPVIPEVEVAPAMIDVFPILGSERVRLDIVIDIVRFRDPPAPKKEEKKSSR